MPLPARLKSGALRQGINQYKWPQSSPVSSSAELAACGGAQLLGCPLTSCGAQPDRPSVGPRHRCSLTAHKHTQLGQTCSPASDVSAAAFHALSASLPNKNINKPPKKKHTTNLITNKPLMLLIANRHQGQIHYFEEHVEHGCGQLALKYFPHSKWSF